ncbi:hypothetical protein L3X38_041330 [Prunus dulcis]|uniref:Ankyrin repeat family protein n=1 Tax=Prunus dulcis TaxID=3755 RepID=A0AAD4YIZ7_PRUDU|nr:hypothetical protein L3X38_041330 [Prunus dulcis]
MEEASDAEVENIESRGKALSIAKVPYEFFMSGIWEGLKKFHKEDDKTEEIVGQLTMNNDTALHVAAFAERNVLEFLLKLLINECTESSLLCAALNVQKNHGNTVFHEVAASGNLDAAKHFLQLEDIVQSKPEYQCVLKIENKLGQTPLYRAAAFRQMKVVEYLASEVEDMELHFKRKRDKISILRIAVIGQHFETALWLLKKHPCLANIKESNGLTSLQLLVQMPSAFGPKFRKSIL